MYVNLNGQIITGTKEELLGKILLTTGDKEKNMTFFDGAVEEYQDVTIVVLGDKRYQIRNQT